MVDGHGEVINEDDDEEEGEEDEEGEGKPIFLTYIVPKTE